MTHQPIHLHNVGFSYSQKICFSELTTTIYPKQRIAIIGRNGSGKTTLLHLLRGNLSPSEGIISIPKGISMGYVPQNVEGFDTLSGAQRFQKALSQALSDAPDILFLDEPTNHLDRANRGSLMGMLRNFPGTIVMITHDVELLGLCTDTLWHIDGQRVHVFSGNYDDYKREREVNRASTEDELFRLNREKKESHEALMKEQVRAKNSRRLGQKHIEQRRWPTVVSTAKACRASETSGKKSKEIVLKKKELVMRLDELRLPEVIVPKFSLSPSSLGGQTMVSISDGSVGYGDNTILKSIHLNLLSGERLAINGDNGSGKSTLMKAIMGDPRVTVTGQWFVPKPSEIGYLDQHYGTLDPGKTVLETIHKCVPTWSHGELRGHLNDFLFRKNEEVNALVSTLSGGERVRLCLAQIAANPPKLLMLDEITNNLDLETRTHVIEVLGDYPGAMIVISHDEDFLKEIGVKRFYAVSFGLSCRA